MTKINKIIMHGFKSFANRTELIFGSDFNCILGPNGSGKSNVIDALCFVLGKGSSKSLRAEKSANLIYNGGKTKSPAKKAEVSMHLDNSTKVFPTDDKEVKITRILNPSGQSKYKINDKTRTRQQILDLLSLARTSPDSYNIILQGDIIRFVEMPTVERRKIVEEIAGISVYEEKKNKALRELEKVEDKLKEGHIILTERKTYLKELKTDRDQALKFEELDKQIKQNKATHLNIQIQGKNKKLKEINARIDSYTQKIEKTQKEINKWKTDVENNKQEIKKINKEIEEQGEKEQVKIHKKIENLRIAIATDKQRVSTCKNEISRIEQRSAQLETTKDELVKKISEIEQEKIALLKQKKEKEKTLSEVNLKINTFKEKNNLNEAGDIEKAVDNIDTQADQKQKEIQHLREEQQNLLREKDKYEFQLNNIDEQIKKIGDVEKEHKKEIEDLKSKREEFKKTTLELNTLLSENSTIAAKLGQKRKILVELREEEAKLNARTASFREGIAANKAIDAILKLKNSISGIHGMVSELGHTDAKYSTALEIAAGPKLKSIIVESDEVAAKCINHLKKNRLGVATFIPLNKIKPRSIDPETKTLAKAQGIHGLALDLISFDVRYKNAFSYIFGGTLVADSIDVARRVGIGKARMITLDGDLIETSGSMQGGFREKRKIQGFQQKNLTKNLQTITQGIADAENTVSVLEKEKEKNEQKIENLRNHKASLEGEIIKAEKSLHLEDSDLNATKNLKKELNEKIASVDQELQKAQIQITEINKQLASYKIKKEELRSKIINLRNPRLLAELNTFEQKKGELRESLIKIDSELKSLSTQIGSILLPEKENVTKILKQLEKEKTGFEHESKKLKSSIKEGEVRLRAKEESEQKFYTQFKSSLSKRSKLNEEIQKIETKIIREEEIASSIEQKSNLQSIEKAKFKAELSGLSEEFAAFKDIKLFTNKTEEQIKKEIWQFEKMVEDMGAVNLRALEIYERVEKEYNALLEKEEKLNSEKDDIMTMMGEIESKKKEKFMVTFKTLNEHFKNIFSQLTTKGDAELELENKEDIFEEGLRIKVRLTGNKFLDIRSLSGGEKTLTALAFIYAIQEHEPAPFYVLDEVDAALDKHNSEKLAKLIRQYSDRAQYIMISHNDSVISEASNLYGISMNEHGQSKIVSLKL